MYSLLLYHILGFYPMLGLALCFEGIEGLDGINVFILFPLFLLITINTKLYIK